MSFKTCSRVDSLDTPFFRLAVKGLPTALTDHTCAKLAQPLSSIVSFLLKKSTLENTKVYQDFRRGLQSLRYVR